LQYTAAVRGPESEPSTAIAHVPALDGLRGIAILLVVAHHFGTAADLPGPSRLAIGRVLERFCYAGWAGVDLFFVLSGFLISSILLATRERPAYFRTFYSRRVLRIFPLYFGTLVLGLLIVPAVATLPPAFVGQARDHAIWLWTYTTNIALATGAVATFGVFDLYWSLAIEEQFYIVWPLLVRVTRPTTLALVCGGIVAGALVWRWLWLGHGGLWWQVYRFTPTRIDELAMGALVALAVREPGARAAATRLAPVVLGAAASVVVYMFLTINPFYPAARAVSIWGHTLLAVLFGSSLFLAVTRTESWLALRLSAPWLRNWGRISYGVYVWHWPLRLVLVGPYAAIAPTTAAAHFIAAIVFFVAGLAGSYAIAWVSYRFYERPFLELKRRVSYVGGRSGRDEVAAPTTGLV
jgi:peptidoglycan/LPS O-acetylase OafA/YrhL